MTDVHPSILRIEDLEARAKVLAARYTLARGTRRGERRFYGRFEASVVSLRTAYQTLAQDIRTSEAFVPAAEWLLDNFHVLEAAIVDVRKNLPRRYYLELPKLAARERAGTARIEAVARELILHSDARLDPQRLARFVESYQTLSPLTIGELWAWPTMLKLGLIENVRALSEEIVEKRAGRRDADRLFARFESLKRSEPPPPLPDRPSTAFAVQLLQRFREYGPDIAHLRASLEERLSALGMTPEEAIRTEHQELARAQASMANSITSLRLCSTLDWSQFFEQVSLVDRALQRDPSLVYGRMEFASRDRYRKAVEESWPSRPEAQVRVALRVIESALQSVEQSPDDRRPQHVGYHLIGPGRLNLEEDVAYRPNLRRRVRRFLFGHTTVLYPSDRRTLRRSAPPGRWSSRRSAIGTRGRRFWRSSRERARGPDRSGGSRPACSAAPPPAHRDQGRGARGGPDMVIIPTLITSPEGVRSLLRHLRCRRSGTTIHGSTSPSSATSPMPRPRRCPATRTR